MFLALILIGYLALGLAYSVVTPLFEAPDESSHYALVQHLASNGLQLPVLNPDAPGPWLQEGGQPPLYYLLAALATARIDTRDFPTVFDLNPHADYGIVPEDGNINAAMHPPGQDALPWQGTVLAVHIARFLSLLMGAVTVLTTYWIGREVFPDWPQIGLLAAALNAFLPMFVFVSATVNNDNLSNMVAGLLVLELVRLLKQTDPPARGVYVRFGVLGGAALLAKLSLGLLLFLVAGALVALAWRQRSWRPVLEGVLIAGGLTVALAGWWYWRNLQLYGDVTGLNVFLQIVGRRTVRADLWQLWTERESLLRSWWGVFGWMNVLMPSAIYTVLSVIGGVGLVGFAAYLLGRVTGKLRVADRVNSWALAVVVLWPVIALVSLLRWTSITWASQGRLLFIAIGPVSIWLAVGLLWWLPVRWRRWISGALVAGLLAVNVVAPLFVIRPAYALPEFSVATSGAFGEESAFYEPGAEQPALVLLGYDLAESAVRPGETLHLTLDLAIEAVPSRRWSLFVHAVDGAGVIVAQRDRFPGQGRLGTEWLSSGQRWVEQVAVTIPHDAYVPETLALSLGFYDVRTGERMVVGSEGATAIRLPEAVVLQEAVTGDAFPNSRNDNFENLIALRGYELSMRRLRPGQPVEVTLYWEALQRMARDYTVFVHVIDPISWTMYAGSDAQPAAWTRPTSTWQPGELVTDTHTLVLSPDTPPGEYVLEIGLYWMPEAGVFERLKVLAERGGETTNVIYLTRVRVTPESEPAE
ncbi:MAG: hypothetical protein Kow0077_04400 [Anaerolineae bacterium]